MKQRFTKDEHSAAVEGGASVGADLVPTLPVCVLLAIDAVGPQGLSRLPWVVSVVVEQLEKQMADGPSRYFDVAKRPGRGVSDGPTQSVTHHLLEVGLIEACGVGREATWRVPAARRGEVDRLWSNLSSQTRAAIRSAGQRAATLEVTLSKTVLAAREAKSGTS